MQRIHNLTQNDDSLHAQICEEGNSCQGQNGRQTWGADESFYLLTNGQTVVSARIEAGILKERCEELSRSNGTPYHHDGQTHKPFQQSYFVGAHHIDCQQQQEDGDEECGKSEATLDKEPRGVSS